MQARRKLLPNQKGAKQFHHQYGAKLVGIRYRDDAARHRRYATVELIVEEAPWTPPVKLAGETTVGLRVTFQKVELQRRVKRAGGKWNPERRLWDLRYDQAVALGLEERIEEPKVSNVDTSEVSNSRHLVVSTSRHLSSTYNNGYSVADL